MQRAVARHLAMCDASILLQALCTTTTTSTVCCGGGSRRRSFCQTMANNTLYRRRDDAFYVAVHLRERREGEKDTLTRSVKESSCVISLRFRVNSFVTNTLSLFVTAQIEGRQGGRVQTGGHLKFNMELTVAQPPKKSKLQAREQKKSPDMAAMAVL